MGPGYFLTEKDSTYANELEAELSSVSFSAGSEGSVITGCILGNIHIYANDIIVNYCKTSGIASSGCSNVSILQNYVGGRITGSVFNSLITNNIVWGSINCYPAYGSLVISNNIVVSGVINCRNSIIQNNIICSDYDPGIYENTGNNIKNNILAVAGTDADGNLYNINMSYVFVDYEGTRDYSTDGKWQLKTGSPAIGAGVGGADCGVFGGNTPYILSGLPNLPRIYEASMPGGVNIEDGLPVTIKVLSGK
jgi:hypothetical protein